MAFHDACSTAQDGIWSDSACDRLSWAAPIPSDLRAELEGDSGPVPDGPPVAGAIASEPACRRFPAGSAETPDTADFPRGRAAPGLRAPRPTPRRGLLERNCRSGTLPAPVAVDGSATDSDAVVSGLPVGLTPAPEPAPESGLTGSTIPDKLFFGGGGLVGFDPLESPAGSALSHISQGSLQSPSFAALDDEAATRPVSTSPSGARHPLPQDHAGGSDSEGSAPGERPGSATGIAFAKAARQRAGSRHGSPPGLSPPQGPSACAASPPRLPPTSCPPAPADLRGGAPPRMVFDARLGCWTIPSFSLAAPSSPALDARTPNPCKLFVGGLGMDTTDANLFAHFSHFGHVASAVVMRNKLTGAPRGFGFVVFTSDRAAAACLNTRQAICGRPVDISPAVPKAPSPAGLARTSPLGGAAGSFTPPHSGAGWASDFAPTPAPTTTLAALPAQGPHRHGGLPDWSPVGAGPAAQASRQPLHHLPGHAPRGGVLHAGPRSGPMAPPHCGPRFGPRPGAGQAYAGPRGGAPHPHPQHHPQHHLQQHQQHHLQHGHGHGVPALPPAPPQFRLPARADGPSTAADAAAAPLAPPSRSADPPGGIRRIFVGGLPQSATEDDLGRHFVRFGEVVGCELMRDRANGRSRGFGFVTFASSAAAAAAAHTRRATVLGQQVDVSFAHPREVGRSRLELMSPTQAALTAAAAERAGQPHALSSLAERRADISC
ncbi:hypothetical protein FNF29_07736 [Cafeteria roenbergensis]|uniref:RRM domain-containing protein n=1 Tax=Cafeteria roenbergensis TaxID=33653 RepID=A0A5A8C1H9_CAFRO|nr:hypothetical protein FNF29_07736 [Cafeteria roenbergensis]|eukprot:KAA0146932.1 hypothetical protein FNF29_07736 [Cafeteria roenbergensis]